MARRNGGIIGPANTPTGGLAGVAKGVWRINDVLNYKKNNQWPVTATAVTNSLRFDDDSSDYLEKTFSGDGTSHDTGTISVWIKRSELSAENLIIAAGSTNRNFIRFESDDTLTFRSVADSFQLTTTQVFRDSSAWYHIVIAFDTTQSTSSDRVKFYVNGTQVTDFGTETYPAQNLDIKIGAAELNRIGKESEQSTLFDGYMAEFVYIDGQQLDASYFGETNSATNIWVPKPIGAQVGSFGTNGFYLDFADSSSLGNDVSGNDNDFTANNLTSVDQSTDIPTNNFCTWNGNIRSDVTLAEGNLEMSAGGVAYDGTVGTIIPTQGKWYAEIKVTVPTNLQIGFITEGTFIDGKRSLYTAGSTIYWQDNVTTIRYYLKGVVQSGHATVTGGSNSVSTYTTDDIIMLAMDLDNGYAWFGKNGTWQNSGDPAGGTNAFNLASDYADGTTIFSGQNNSAVQANFGSPPYSISSGNSDGNGYGNFEYAVPSGYYALNSANLNTYG